MKKAIESARASKPIGPYSQAVQCAGLVFVSGQIPVDISGNLSGADVAAQTELCLQNLAAVLEASGLGLDHVVKATVFMTDLKHFPAMNEVYARHFKPPYPARATVQISALPKGASVEIEAIADVRA